MPRCDSCGREVSWAELVETIEEYLCENCASGIGPEGGVWEPPTWEPWMAGTADVGEGVTAWTS